MAHEVGKYTVHDLSFIDLSSTSHDCGPKNHYGTSYKCQQNTKNSFNAEWLPAHYHTDGSSEDRL
eukprot:CAMPEP_0203702648 /NCGR_PEP_ID=MMETSP0091-20130426/40269_1 /ASSEMBLY_ACC=CAM_ASM_001089 /TAXON_ID=426623 /ORGANISM="Chaetoceros affinis, Strain CCMP159" /LENGTH=64 /DNA_ID=CAMNT_0050576919 /DNA_START=45 /DNA_END=235 /DNA_ORIENTATION=+